MNEKNINKLLDGLTKESNYTRTENLALTYASTLNHLLDYFSMGGALRTRQDKEVISLFSKAFSQDKLLAMKCLFYFRDIRGGQGERKTFRTILNHLGNAQKEIIVKNLENIPYYGRWDDFYSLVDTETEKAMFDFMKGQFIYDLENEKPSLLGKWMKSINTSSKESRELARKTMNALEIESEKKYRKGLAELRRKIKVLERKMCFNQWKSIQYDKVPSNASLKYRKAFKRHDPEGYEAYLKDVAEGKKEIKTKTLYPYDLMRIARDNYDKTVELQWKNLPNYVEDTNDNWIVVCDTSGSMCGLSWNGRRTVEPILVSTSLSIYFAERNKGPFENKFITFSMRPRLQSIIGESLHEKYLNLSKAEWQMNTNLTAVFELILNTAQKYNVPQNDMINKICIISDMEFDQANGGGDITNYEYIKEMYRNAEYEMPTLVFWNVESRQNQSPITIDDNNVFLVSGCSPSILKNLMKTTTMNAYDMMLEVLNSERYNKVVI